MLWTRFKAVKNKRAMTLVEMIVAIAVTAILAVCLSMVMSPVIKTYSVNKARAELATYADAVLNHMADDFREARNILIPFESKDTPAKNSFQPAHYGVPALVDIDYGYALIAKYPGSNRLYISKSTIICWSHGNYPRYVYPADIRYTYYDLAERIVPVNSLFSFTHYTSDQTDKPNYFLKNIDSATGGIYVENNDDFYILVKENPDTTDPNGTKRGQIIDIHLRLTKGKVHYPAVKTVVCETLVINNIGVQRASDNGRVSASDPVKVSTSDDINNTKACFPYYSVWFGVGIHR